MALNARIRNYSHQRFSNSIFSLVVLVHVILADDDGFDDDLTFDERQSKLRTWYNLN